MIEKIAFEKAEGEGGGKRDAARLRLWTTFQTDSAVTCICIQTCLVFISLSLGELNCAATCEEGGASSPTSRSFFSSSSSSVCGKQTFSKCSARLHASTMSWRWWKTFPSPECEGENSLQSSSREELVKELTKSRYCDDDDVIKIAELTWIFTMRWCLSAIPESKHFSVKLFAEMSIQAANMLKLTLIRQLKSFMNSCCFIVGLPPPP